MPLCQHVKTMQWRCSQILSTPTLSFSVLDDDTFQLSAHLAKNKNQYNSDYDYNLQSRLFL